MFRDFVFGMAKQSGAGRFALSKEERLALRCAIDALHCAVARLAVMDDVGGDENSDLIKNRAILFSAAVVYLFSKKLNNFPKGISDYKILKCTKNAKIYKWKYNIANNCIRNNPYNRKFKYSDPNSPNLFAFYKN